MLSMYSRNPQTIGTTLVKSENISPQEIYLQLL